MKTLITAERLFLHHRFANLSLLSNLAPSLPPSTSLSHSLTHSFAWKHTYNKLAQRTSLSLPRVTMTTGCCEHLAKLPNTHPAVLMPVDCPSLLVTHALWFISRQSKRHLAQYRHSFWPNGACCHTFVPFGMLWFYTFLVLESDTVQYHIESLSRFSWQLAPQEFCFKRVFYHQFYFFGWVVEFLWILRIFLIFL